MSQLDQAFIRAYGRKAPTAPTSASPVSVAPQSSEPQAAPRIDDPAEAILAAVDDLLRQARPLSSSTPGAPQRGSHFVTSATAGTEQALSPLPGSQHAQPYAGEPIILPHPEKTASERELPAAPAQPEPAPKVEAAPEPKAEEAPEPAMQSLSEVLGLHDAALVERAPFRAAWEVDQFHWPQVCDLLLEAGEDLLDEITGRIHMAAGTGRNLLVVRGTRRGAGTTAAAAFFARVMAGTGLHVALLDGDLENPQLGAQLGLGNYHGWEHALADEAPLEESAVASIEDALTLLPLGHLPDPPRVHVDPERLATKLSHLVTDFDLVVIDAGAVCIDSKSLAGLPGLPAELTATLLVSDMRHGGREPAAARRLIAESGELLVGTYENFAPCDSEALPEEMPSRKMAA